MESTIIEYIGAAAGLLYIWFEIRQRPAMWWVGILNSVMYICVFASAKFYAGMLLNVYYTGVSIYGLWAWRKGKEEHGNEFTYSTLKLRELLALVALALLLSGILIFILIRFTDSPVPVGDGLVSAFSVVATWMLAKRWIEHWYIWIGVELFSTFLYASQGLYPTAFMYLCYSVLVFLGLSNWRKKGKHVQRNV